jgi:hypothetical protein
MSLEGFSKGLVTFLVKICDASDAKLHEMHAEWSRELEESDDPVDQTMLRGYLSAIEKEQFRRGSPKEAS